MKHFRMIEEYLEGNMSQEARNEFEHLLSFDQNLRKDTDLSKEINEAIGEEDIQFFRDTVNEVLKTRIKTTSKWMILAHTFFKFPIAAAIVALIGFSLWQIFTVKSGQYYFNELYAPYQVDITTRSMNNLSKNKIKLSCLLYQEENYQRSFKLLNKYLTRHSKDNTAEFYLGMDAIELRKYNLAIQALSAVAKDPSSLYSLHAKWYLALTLLRVDHKEKAKAFLKVLASSDNLYSDRSKKLLKHL